MPTNVSAALPDLTLEEQSILTIDTGNAGATITQVVIHVSQAIPEIKTVAAPVVPLFAYAVES